MHPTQSQDLSPIIAQLEKAFENQLKNPAFVLAFFNTQPIGAPVQNLEPREIVFNVPYPDPARPNVA